MPPFKTSLGLRVTISMLKCGCCNEIYTICPPDADPAYLQGSDPKNRKPDHHRLGWRSLGGDFSRERSELSALYWSDTPAVRRKKLFPFFWNTVEQNGQLYGNRDLGNKADVS